MPKRLREADAKLNGERAAVVSAKEALTQALAQRKKLELDVQQWKDRAEEVPRPEQLRQNQRGLQGAADEIATADGRSRQGRRPRAGTVMNIEEAERRVNCWGGIEESEHVIAAEKKEMERQFAEKEGPGKQATTERRGIAKKIPEDSGALRTDRQKASRTALAQVRDGQCKACGLRRCAYGLQLLESDADEEIFRMRSCDGFSTRWNPLPTPRPGVGYRSGDS